MRPALIVAAMIGAMPVLAVTDAMARVPMCTAAGTGIAAAPGTRNPVPLPDRALLAPPPQFDCAFKADDEPPPNPPPAQGDPGTDAALRKKLDHERQCYRHAEMILRDRLLLLQGPAGDTIRPPPSAARQAPRPGRARNRQRRSPTRPCSHRRRNSHASSRPRPAPMRGSLNMSGNATVTPR